MVNVFEMVDFLEPKCPVCKSKIKYGITTKYDDDKEGHVCLSCGNLLK